MERRSDVERIEALGETDVRRLAVWAGGPSEFALILSHAEVPEGETEYSLTGRTETQVLHFRVESPEIDVAMRFPLGSLQRIVDFLGAYAEEFRDADHNR